MYLLFVWFINGYWNKVLILSLPSTCCISFFLLRLIWYYTSPLPSIFTHQFWGMRRKHRGGWSTIWCVKIIQGWYMWVVCNYIMFIHRSRSSIWTQKNWVRWKTCINMRWHIVMRILWYAWIRVCWYYWVRIIRIDLCRFSSCKTLVIASSGKS